jgi:hypothetical protein
MDTYGVQIKGIRCSFLIWFVGLVLLVQEIFILPWLLWSAQYNIFFSSPSTLFYFYVFPPLPSNLGRQSSRAACLSECVPAYKNAAHRLCLGGFCGGVQKYCHQRCQYSSCAPCGGQEKNTPSSRKIVLGVGKCTYKWWLTQMFQNSCLHKSCACQCRSSRQKGGRWKSPGESTDSSRSAVNRRKIISRIFYGKHCFPPRVVSRWKKRQQQTTSKDKGLFTKNR